MFKSPLMPGEQKLRCNCFAIVPVLSQLVTFLCFLVGLGIYDRNPNLAWFADKDIDHRVLIWIAAAAAILEFLGMITGLLVFFRKDVKWGLRLKLWSLVMSTLCFVASLVLCIIAGKNYHDYCKPAGIVDCSKADAMAAIFGVAFAFALITPLLWCCVPTVRKYDDDGYDPTMDSTNFVY